MIKYTLRIQESLIFSIKNASGHPLHRVLSFFDGKVEEMIAVEPNIKSLKYNKYQKLIKVENKVWVLRGYYPGTPVFFKLSVIGFDVSHMEGDDPYLVKVINPNKPKMHNIKSMHIKNEAAECELLGHDMDMKIKRQRIMTPRGVKPCPFGAKDA